MVPTPATSAKTDSDTRSTKPLAGDSGSKSTRSNKQPKTKPKPKRKPTGKRSTKQSAQYSINDFTRDEVMTVIREVFREREDVGRDAAVKLIFKGLQQDGLAARRLGSKIRDKLESHLTAAVRRGIIYRDRGLYNLDCRRITDYARADLIKYLCAAIGRTWHTRDQATTATARYLGFRRTGKVIKETLKSTINAAIRRNEIERDGPKLIRKY